MEYLLFVNNWPMLDQLILLQVRQILRLKKKDPESVIPVSMAVLARKICYESFVASNDLSFILLSADYF